MGRVILVVDDDPQMLKTYESILKKEGHVVIARDNGKAALADIMTVLRPDLVITEYGMPGMNGLELVAILRKTVQNIPVIVCSLHMKTDLYAKAFELGVATCLSKPFSDQELHLAVDMALKSGEKASAIR